MALSIGLPGLPTIPGLPAGGPFFITGEPRREYYFQFLLRRPNTVNMKSWTSILFSEIFLWYISGLAEKVTLPSHKFNLGQVQLANLQVPFPQHFELATLSVSYMEDELGSVGIFHRIWMENIRGYDDAGSSGGGLTFAELGRVCASAVYAPSKKIPLPLISPEVPIPFGMETFPRIFPVQIDRDASNHSGNNVSKVTVVYARVPKIMIPGFTYHWYGREGNVVKVHGDRDGFDEGEVV